MRIRTYLDRGLLLLLTIWANPFRFAVLHVAAHLPRNADAFAMEPFFTFITANHEAIVMRRATYTPKTAMKKKVME